MIFMIINSEIEFETSKASANRNRHPETRNEPIGEIGTEVINSNEIITICGHPLTVERKCFKYKSLRGWGGNPFVGCQHACRFCHISSVSISNLKGQLRADEDIANQLGLADRYHPGPDSTLGSRSRRRIFGSECSDWLDACWSWISAWPTGLLEGVAA
jgi:hypothetical protein